MKGLVRLEFACLRRPSHALYYVRLVRLFGAAPGWLTKARKGVCLDSKSPLASGSASIVCLRAQAAAAAGNEHSASVFCQAGNVRKFAYQRLISR